MPSIIPSLFGRRTNKLSAQEPLSGDIWEPLGGFSFATTTLAVSPHETADMDWKETPDAHVFITDLPGVRKEEVNVEVEQEKVLKISGRRVKESEEKGDKWHRVERSAHKFCRTVRLPHDTNTDGMKAKLENGVLTVTLPKEQDRKAPVRFLQIEG
ncbi:18.1 kDa class I heat shock protein-like [Musa acuminata AAA Group]|uniref:18.1 kDa class I heat shock protein-like n=1 Tax=Musa acuminata AAA Group TaxID=214697 RepID=UPI0031DFC1F8